MPVSDWLIDFIDNSIGTPWVVAICSFLYSESGQGMSIIVCKAVTSH